MDGRSDFYGTEFEEKYIDVLNVKYGWEKILGGFGVAVWLALEKLLHQADVMSKHGPLMIFGAVLLLAGLNMLAIGLLGEMQVRHYHEPSRRAPYSVERVVRAQSEESTISE